MSSLKQLDCAGEVVVDSISKTGGSCVLVDKKFALSAAHVLAEFEFNPDTIKTNGQKMIVNVASNPKVTDISKFYLNFENQKHKIKSVVFHPDYSKNFPNGAYAIALIELKKKIKIYL